MNSEAMPKCPKCGALLPADAPDGLCPQCVMALNLKTETVFTDESLAAQPPLPPEQIAPHFPQLEILECLGRGGMGVVYKARQKTLNRLVALKLLAPERVGDVKFAERFTHEAQALAALNHPNIVTIHDFGQAGGFYFLLMEFVDGVNLRQLLRVKRFTPEEALAIVPPLCDALEFAHERGIVHRDIKPENLLLDKTGRVKVADFGIAKMLGKVGDDGEKVTLENGTQNALGTPGYNAPEQRSDPQQIDSRADIYSLGVVFYEMLTGELPGKQIEPPSRKVQIDVRLDQVVLRALEKTPELRWQTAADLRTQVEAITQTGKPTTMIAPQFQSLGKWALFFSGLSGILGAVTFCFWPGPPELLVWSILVAALLGIFLGVKVRKTPLGKKAFVGGIINTLIWLVVFTVCTFYQSKSVHQGQDEVVAPSLGAKAQARLSINENAFWESPPRRLEQAPSILILRPTQFDQAGGETVTASGKIVLRNRPLKKIISIAYGNFDPEKIVLPNGALAGNFDLMLTLTDLPHTALREEIMRQFGLVARRETTNNTGLLIIERTGNPTFDPVMERTVSGAIDFDSGRLAELPVAQTSAAETAATIFAWMEQQGMDAFFTDYYLVGFRTRVKLLKDDDWDKLNAEQLLQIIAIVDTHGSPPVAMKPHLNIPFSVTGFGSNEPSSKPPTDMTWGFRTREGALGILQIIGGTENPSALKIRYKLVKTQPVPTRIINTPVVTLLDIERHKASGIEAWQPDGNLLPDNLRGALVRSDEHPPEQGDGRPTYLVSLLVANPPPDEMWEGGWSASFGDGAFAPMMRTHEILPDLHGTLFRLSVGFVKSQPAADFRFGIAVEPRRTLLVMEGKQFKATAKSAPFNRDESLPDITVESAIDPAGSPLGSAHGTPIVRVHLTLPGDIRWKWDWHMMVQDKNGKEVFANQFPRADADPNTLVEEYDLADPADVSKIVLQGRSYDDDYQWTRFPNVPLLPK